MSIVGVGTNTAALGIGGTGSPPSPSGVANTQSWNGTSWTEINDLNTARRGSAGSGIQTAAIYFNAFGPATSVVESFDGVSWTEVADMSVQRGFLAAGTAFT